MKTVVAQEDIEWIKYPSYFCVNSFICWSCWGPCSFMPCEVCTTDAEKKAKKILKI